MSVSHEDLQAALAGLLTPSQIQEIKVKNGKVLLTVSAQIPTGEKPSFAESVKKRVRAVEGVADVFVSFAAPPAQAAAPEGGPRTAPMPNIDRIVAVGAGKGGVGKSTVSVNLAIALARQGKRVGLLDADIYGPSAAIMTGTGTHKAQGDAQQRVIPALAHGVRVISIAFLLPPDQKAVVWRGPMVGKMVEQLLTGVAWGELDYLIVDLPPGTGDAVLSLSQKVPLAGAIVVTTPQDVALLDVLKAIEMFGSVRVPVVGVVENMSGYTCPSCGHHADIFLTGAGEKAAKQFGVPLLGKLPLDPEIPPGGDSGRPILVERPESSTSQAFLDIADAAVKRLDEMGAGAAQFTLNWSSGV